MKTIKPYLIFNGNAIEVFRFYFYKSIFGGDFELVRFSDMPGTERMTKEYQNKAANIALPIAGEGQLLMASDAPTGNEAVIVIEKFQFRTQDLFLQVIKHQSENYSYTRLINAT